MGDGSWEPGVGSRTGGGEASGGLFEDGEEAEHRRAREEEARVTIGERDGVGRGRHGAVPVQPFWAPGVRLSRSSAGGWLAAAGSPAA